MQHTYTVIPGSSRPTTERDWTTPRGMLTLILFAAVILAAVLPTMLHASPATTTHAAGMEAGSAKNAHLVYRRGYSVQGSWLCYGWSTGAFHCTQRWFRSSNGALVSLTPWVPNGAKAASVIAASGKSTGAYSTVAAVVNPHSIAYPFGQCTYGAAILAHDNVNGLGNAYQWFANARAHGLPTGYTPRAGSTVVFQRGVDGASLLYGHVAHVVAVGANGSFEIEAMNDAAGWGRFAFRWVTMRPGIGFIY